MRAPGIPPTAMLAASLVSYRELVGDTEQGAFVLLANLVPDQFAAFFEDPRQSDHS